MATAAEWPAVYRSRASSVAISPRANERFAARSWSLAPLRSSAQSALLLVEQEPSLGAQRRDVEERQRPRRDVLIRECEERNCETVERNRRCDHWKRIGCDVLPTSGPPKPVSHGCETGVADLSNQSGDRRRGHGPTRAFGATEPTISNAARRERARQRPRPDVTDSPG